MFIASVALVMIKSAPFQAMAGNDIAPPTTPFAG
jgi:hypothetical protein